MKHMLFAQADTFRTKALTASVLALVVVLTASCGGSQMSQRSTTNLKQHDILPPDDGGTNNNGGGGSGGGNGGGGSGGNNLLEPYEFDVHGTGYNPVTIDVPASVRLRIRFEPQQQQMNIQNTGYYVGYSRLAAEVSVVNASGSAQFTPLLSNGYITTAQHIDRDLSSYVSAGSGGMVTIKVDRPNYDYECLYWGLGCNPGWTHVQNGHPWWVKLIVETEDTTTLP